MGTQRHDTEVLTAAFSYRYIPRGLGACLPLSAYVFHSSPRASMASLRLSPMLFVFLCCTNALRRSTEDELVRPSGSSIRDSPCTCCRKHGRRHRADGMAGEVVSNTGVGKTEIGFDSTLALGAYVKGNVCLHQPLLASTRQTLLFDAAGIDDAGLQSSKKSPREREWFRNPS